MRKDKRKKKHEAAETAASSSEISRKEFEKQLAKLQVELVRLQTWVKAKGARVIVVFEGRDTAGKGGVISRITARTSPRVFRHLALPAPSSREKSQVYSSATSQTFRQRVRSFYSIAHGTIEPGSSG